MRRKTNPSDLLNALLAPKAPYVPRTGPSWVQTSLDELDRRQREREADQRAEAEAQRQAELAATPTTTLFFAELSRATSSAGSTPALNSPQLTSIIEAALAGGSGTTSGD